MEKLFIVVTSEKNDGIYKKVMSSYNAEKHVFNRVVNLDEDDKLLAIYSIDIYGEVVRYQVAFDGRLKLEEK